MTSIDDLKRAILFVEKQAKFYETFAPTIGLELSAEAEQSYRIAAACMWEKLERLEKEEPMELETMETEALLLELDRQKARADEAYQLFCLAAASRCAGYVATFCEAGTISREIKAEIRRRKEAGQC